MNSAGNLHRIFDYVDVPSRFVGTRLWYNPDAFVDSANTPPLYFSIPFNHLSRFRNPGKININTIADTTSGTGPSILDGVLFGLDLTSADRDGIKSEILTSRQSGIAQDSIPTKFGNPFRPANAAGLMPALGPGGTDTQLQDTPEHEVGITRPGQGALTMNSHILTNLNGSSYQDADRNPYFTNQILTRLGDNLTTNSNVFAVWVTVGYFEYEDTNGDGVPEFGREVGEETGQIQRHRAFYMIDRSIPVAFEPGVTHNEKDTIILRRMIE